MGAEANLILAFQSSSARGDITARQGLRLQLSRRPSEAIPSRRGLPESKTAERNEEYDPCTDDTLTLEQITKYIYDQDAEIKSLFKKCKSVNPDNPEKKQLETEISEAKAKLKAYLQKEK